MIGKCTLFGLLLVSVAFQFDFVKSASGDSESGICSYYTGGGTTASGEPFDENALTAAHKSLPFGTMIRVYNGDRSVDVKITDRGPFVEGRIVDVSLEAARQLGVVEQGIWNCNYVEQ